MVIFLLGEDRAYLSWLAHHRGGFVLDWLRKPTGKRPIVHRATCAEIKSSKTKKTHWTTGKHIKVCSLDLEELVLWASEESRGDPDYCELCKPADDTVPVEASGDRHLTMLGKEIVDCIVEAAVICLDWHDSGYEMTVGAVAQSLGKTPAQISNALIHLAEDRYLRLGEKPESGTTLPADCKVFPTSDALRLLPAFATLPRGQLEAELESLTDED